MEMQADSPFSSLSLSLELFCPTNKTGGSGSGTSARVVYYSILQKEQQKLPSHTFFFVV